MNPVVVLVAGVIGGAVLAWLVAQARHRAQVAALEAALEAERRFADERRTQAVRADAFLGQLAALTETHRDLSAQTQHLVDTLRSPVVRGQWGEMQLQRVCELAQMTEHVDFVTQATVPGPESRLRPDLTVLLPGGRTVVVDAKAPLAAFLDAMEAVDAEDRDAALDAHARQVRDHVTRLGSRAYWEQFDESPDFVVLFLPGEALFSAAVQADPGLIEYGVDRRVILASPTTLIALLRVVSRGWERQRVARHADEIREAGVELHARLETWAGHLGEVRRGLERAVEAYNRGVGALEQRVLPQARRLGELAGSGDGSTPAVPRADAALRTDDLSPR